MPLVCESESESEYPGLQIVCEWICIHALLGYGYAHSHIRVSMTIV